ncbi:MAG: prepilin-type N-terminal cleavage/methylation domain-containing protein [Thermodesulfobacteriota bacterium]
MAGGKGIRSRDGFTLVELIMIILIIGILSVVLVHRLPSNLDEEAAIRELRRAIRLAQHQAMTRQYTNAGAAWGISVAGNQYSVQRRGADCAATPANCAGIDYLNRFLIADATMTLVGGPVWFNGLGEPIDPDGTITGTAGAPLPTATTFTVAGARTVTVSPRTGYVQ